MAATERSVKQAAQRAQLRAAYAPVEVAKANIAEAKAHAEQTRVAHVQTVRQSGNVRASWRTWQDAEEALTRARSAYQAASLAYQTSKAAWLATRDT